MGKMFKGSEILGLAVKIEQNGCTFYTTVQEMAETDAVREIFGFLAGEEKKHEAVFSEILKNVGEYKPAAPLREDYALYMQALADSHIFKDDETIEQMAKAAGNMTEALEMGIGFEKDSIIFFTDRLYVPAPL